jgi:hypothetical protein
VGSVPPPLRSAACSCVPTESRRPFEKRRSDTPFRRPNPRIQEELGLRCIAEHTEPHCLLKLKLVGGIGIPPEYLEPWAFPVSKSGLHPARRSTMRALKKEEQSCQAL